MNRFMVMLTANDAIYNPNVDPATMTGGADVTTMAVLGVMLLVICSALGFIATAGTAKPSKAKAKIAKQRKLQKKFNFLSSNFLTKSGFDKLVDQLNGMSILSIDEVKEYSVKTYINGNLILLAFSIAGLFMFDDILSIILTVVYGYCIRTVRMEKSLDNIHHKVLHQLKAALADMRQNFIKTASITDSIEQIKVGSLLERPFADILDILTGENSERKLNIFYEKTEFKLLQTFANVCFTINRAGDSKNERGGSVFVEAISMLSTEINLELRRIQLQKAIFGSLEIMPLIPLFGAEGLAAYLQGVIPGTIVIYKGLLGYISRISIIVSSIAGYTLIARANSVVTIKVDDRSYFINNLLSNKNFAKFINNILPRTIKEVSYYKKLAKLSMTRQSIQHIFAKKVVYAVAGFVISMALGVGSIFLAKDFVFNNLQETSLVAGSNTSAEFYTTRQALDDEYMAMPAMVLNERDIKDLGYSKIPMREPATIDLVKSYFPSMADYDLQLEAERVMSKYDEYYNLGWKWWIVLVSIGVGMYGWKMPNKQLNSRIKQIKSESEEDVLQLQTIIAILMYTPIDTMDMLYWMSRQSKVYKDVLTEAYNEYASDPLLALNRLKNNVNSDEFYRIIDKLILTIHQVEMVDAFGDLITERSHLLQMRETVQISALEKRAAMVKPLAQLPLVLVMLLYMLLPIGILGAKEFSKAMESMNNM